MRTGPYGPYKKKDPVVRFWSKVVMGENGCQVHIGAPGSHGYSQFSYMGRMQPAHKFVMGQMAPGMTTDHICENKRCVNVEHLQVVSRGDNVRLFHIRRGSK